MEKIKIIPAKPVAKPEIGDVLYGEEFLSKIEIYTVELFKTSFENPASNRLIQPSMPFTGGFSGLSALSIDAAVLQEQVRYNCPWTDNQYYWMYPLGVVSDDEERYGIDREKTPWLCRTINQQDDMDNIDPSHLNTIVKTMLGHGYTVGTRPSDGHGEVVLGTIPLDNGDELLVACWVWFNK